MKIKKTSYEKPLSLVEELCPMTFLDGLRFAFSNTSLAEAVQKLVFYQELDYANCLRICHKKYSVWALALKA